MSNCTQSLVGVNGTYFYFSVLKHIPQILSDAIVWTQVLLSEIDSFLVRENRSWIRPQELLLDTHIVVSYRKHSCPVFGGLCW